jgi:ribosome recycling factor
MNIKEASKRFEKTIEFFEGELAKIQGSRANPRLIEDIEIEAYGSSMPVKQVGTVTVIDPTLITVSCWDKNTIDSVKKAIEDAEIGVNPIVDGMTIKVPLPPLSQERREELIKVIKKIAEDAKIAIRSIRHEILEDLRKEDISEDDIERGEKEIQRLVDEFNELIEEEYMKKEKEILTI